MLVKTKNYFENYAREHLKKYFLNYPFVESIKVFFRGKNHPYKKVKLQARLKGKDVFVEGTGPKHDVALDVASEKLSQSYLMLHKVNSANRV